MGITSKQRGRHLFPDGVMGAVKWNAVDGPIASLGGTAFLTKTSIGAYTLPAPTSDGLTLNIVSRTAFAHVVTATGLLDDGTGAASKNTITYAAFPGASISLVSGGGKWNALAKNATTVA